MHQPPANGLTEAFNKTLCNMLKKVWDTMWLPLGIVPAIEPFYGCKQRNKESPPVL